MTATKSWGQCSCGCGKNIRAGDEFVNVEGEFYLIGCIKLGMMEDMPQYLEAAQHIEMCIGGYDE